jgi:O-antigen/teichoic acid export membrane protein
MLRAAASQLLDLGITPCFIRLLPSFLRESRDRTRSLLFTGVPIVYAGLAVVTVAAFVLADSISELVLRDASSGWMIRIICIGFFPFTTTKICEYIIWGRAQFGTLSFLQTLESFIRPIAIVALYLRFDLPGVVAAFVLVEAVMAGAFLYCVRDLFGGARPPWYPVRQLLTESFPLYLEGWVWYLRAHGDNWLVSILLGPTALAVYFVAGIMINQLKVISTAVDRIALERLGRHLGNPETISEKALSLHETISRFVLPGILWLLAITPLATIMIGGEEYQAAIVPALVLVMVMFAEFLFLPLDRAVFVGTPPRFRLFKTSVEAGTVVAAAAILTPLTGLAGIASARLLGAVAGGVYGMIVLRQRLKLTIPFGELWRTVLTAVPGTLLVLWFTPPVTGFVEAITVGVIATGAWLASFLVLVLLFNRPLMRALLAEVGRALGREARTA